MAQEHKFFESGQLSQSQPAEDLDTRIVNALRYMTTEVISNAEEVNLEVARDTFRELSRRIASRTLDTLAKNGIEIRQTRCMDLGAGLGMLSEEAASRGANPVAIEPGNGFREITLERIRRSGRGGVIAAVGEHLPFRNSSFDIVISLQVLEHVEHPAAVIHEVYRILKPGGWFYLTCPNYLSFYEGHYRVAWLPLLPKYLGSLYLRLRRRPTEFLNTSVTYTTLPSVRRMLRRSGFLSARDRKIYALCRSPSSIKVPWKRRVVLAARRWRSTDNLTSAVELYDLVARLCTPNFSELVQKPPESDDRTSRAKREGP
jgi:2-polyprenyl-3-methyl-5-hydroxy-6-metoxy-1,4-benzoquinol methylase